MYIKEEKFYFTVGKLIEVLKTLPETYLCL